MNLSNYKAVNEPQSFQNNELISILRWEDYAIIPALAKRRVGSLWGTTGLDGQNLWPFPLKKSKYVSLTLFAGHLISDGSEPGMTATEEEEKQNWSRVGGV